MLNHHRPETFSQAIMDIFHTCSTTISIRANVFVFYHRALMCLLLECTLLLSVFLCKYCCHYVLAYEVIKFFPLLASYAAINLVICFSTGGWALGVQICYHVNAAYCMYIGRVSMTFDPDEYGLPQTHLVKRHSSHFFP